MHFVRHWSTFCQIIKAISLHWSNRTKSRHSHWCIGLKRKKASAYCYMIYLILVLCYYIIQKTNCVMFCINYARWKWHFHDILERRKNIDQKISAWFVTFTIILLYVWFGCTFFTISLRNFLMKMYLMHIFGTAINTQQ